MKISQSLIATLLSLYWITAKPKLQAHIAKKEVATPQILGVAETPPGGTTFAGDNFVFRADQGVTTFPRNGLPSTHYDVPPPLRPGMALPMQFVQGQFWTREGKKIYKYQSKLKMWIQVAETPVEFRDFIPLFDDSFLLLKTLKLEQDRLLYPQALLERWDGKELETMIPIPNSIKSHLSIRDFDGPFWDIEMHEFEEFILIYDRFTGYLAVYQPGKGLKGVTTPWEQVPFEDFFKIQSDPKFRSRIEILRNQNVKPEEIPVIRSKAPYPIQFIPTTPGKVLIVYNKQDSDDKNHSTTLSHEPFNNNGENDKKFHFYSKDAEAFEIDLATFDRLPITIPENIEFPWWFDDRKGLIPLKSALEQKK
jgi:hypothetical protein